MNNLIFNSNVELGIIGVDRNLWDPDLNTTNVVIKNNLFYNNDVTNNHMIHEHREGSINEVDGLKMDYNYYDRQYNYYMDKFLFKSVISLKILNIYA